MGRLMLTGTNSGCGKTTVTCAVLAALKARALSPVAFKCGPDFIDPMFHRAVTGVAAYNLDPFFLDGGGLRSHLAGHAGGLAVIEGAMGFYDGIAATDNASAFTVARVTGTPVVLVVSAKGAGASLGAVIEGFARHRDDSMIKGVIFNDADESRYADLRGIAENTGVKPYGTIPRKAEWSLPHRHLGLLTADEVSGLKELLDALGKQAEETLDMDGLLALAGTAAPIEAEPPLNNRTARVRLSVARDEAFCFIYEENLELLRQHGCEFEFFSPIKDSALPRNIDGLYLCGGNPELYADALSDNASMRESIKHAVTGGLPTVAECGGFLYLHDTLDGKPMCGVIGGKAYATNKLCRFGYVTLTAKSDNMLCGAGESARAHEFHYWDSDSTGDGFTAQKAGRGQTYSCVHATETMYAGFPHLYFPANPKLAINFIKRMEQYDNQ